MIDLLHHYTTALCSLLPIPQALPSSVRLALSGLAGTYVMPTVLALVTFIFWFEGKTPANRAANQQAVLRGLVAALIAGGLATLSRLALEQLLGETERRLVSEWACWRGVPAISKAAAAGTALAAALWRRDWRGGLSALLAANLWAAAQVGCGLHYPLDVAGGAATGVALGWLLGKAHWLDRPLNVVIGLVRRLMVA